jgi:hypothetical protein
MAPELPLFRAGDLGEARIASPREREFWALMLGPALDQEGVARHRAGRSTRTERRRAVKVKGD